MLVCLKSDSQVTTPFCMNLTTQLASAGFRALLSTGVDLLAGEAVDALSGIFEGGFGTATVTWLQGNDQREGVGPTSQWCWRWPFPLRLNSERNSYYIAQVATGLRMEGDLKCYLSPWIAALPDMPDWPTADGWYNWLQQHPSSLQMGLRSVYKGPFVVVWRDGVDWEGNQRTFLHGAPAGVVDSNGEFRPLTLGLARAVSAGHPYTLPPPSFRQVHEAWGNALQGESHRVPQGILNLFLSAAAGAESPREVMAEAMAPRRSPVVLGALAALLFSLLR